MRILSIIIIGVVNMIFGIKEKIANRNSYIIFCKKLFIKPHYGSNREEMRLDLSLYEDYQIAMIEFYTIEQVEEVLPQFFDVTSLKAFGLYEDYVEYYSSKVTVSENKRIQMRKNGTFKLLD